MVYNHQEHSELPLVFSKLICRLVVVVNKSFLEGVSCQILEQ